MAAIAATAAAAVAGAVPMAAAAPTLDGAAGGSAMQIEQPPPAVAFAQPPTVAGGTGGPPQINANGMAAAAIPDAAGAAAAAAAAAAAGGGGGGAAKPAAAAAATQQAVNPYAHNLTRTSPETVEWLHVNFAAAEHISLARSTLYDYYKDHCATVKSDPNSLNAASFGKLIRSVFPKLKTRRLGTRGNSRYHYYGIRVKDGSNLVFDKDQIGGPQQRARLKNDDKEAVAPETGEPLNENCKFMDQRVRLPAFTCIREWSSAAAAAAAEGAPTYPLSAQADFSLPYHAHCKEILTTLQHADFESLKDQWCQFWGVIAAHFRPMLSTEAGAEFVDECDALFFEKLHEALITDVLKSMSDPFIQDLRGFSKKMEPWLRIAMESYPGVLLEKKLQRVRNFAHTLRRYTSLNHLAKAATAVFTTKEIMADMIKDLNHIQFDSIMSQAETVCRCPRAVATKITSEFKGAMGAGFTIVQWAEWLQKTLKEWLEKTPNPQADARKFLTRWCYFSSTVIRDLTLRSAKTFGSFHLIRLLYDEYILYLVEQVAQKGIVVLDTVPAGCGKRQYASEADEIAPRSHYGGGGGGGGAAAPPSLHGGSSSFDAAAVMGSAALEAAAAAAISAALPAQAPSLSSVSSVLGGGLGDPNMSLGALGGGMDTLVGDSSMPAHLQPAGMMGDASFDGAPGGAMDSMLFEDPPIA